MFTITTKNFCLKERYLGSVVFLILAVNNYFTKITFLKTLYFEILTSSLTSKYKIIFIQFFFLLLLFVVICY